MFYKLKLILTNDWSVGGTSIAAISTMRVDQEVVTYWLPWLSQEAAYLLPILGVLLLAVQIYFKIKEPKDW